VTKVVLLPEAEEDIAEAAIECHGRAGRTGHARLAM
jgi:hypothetical protein